jgi:hypothetical protein
MIGGSKGASPLSRYSISEIDATAQMLSRCSIIDGLTGNGGVRVNETYMELAF